MNTEKLIREAKARFKHQEAKIYLQEKYSNRLEFASQGGSWTATPELISFLTCFSDHVVLVDNYNNPVKVSVDELLTEAKILYQSVMEEWLAEFKELSNLR